MDNRDILFALYGGDAPFVENLFRSAVSREILCPRDASRII